MASIDYEAIFGSFLENVTDYNLAGMSLSTASQVMTGYLHKAAADPYLRKIFTTLKLDDDVQVLTYEMEHEIDEETDREFVTMIFGKRMVLAWVSPKAQSTTNTAQMFGGKEQKFYSQQSHLSELQALKKNIESEIRHNVMDRGYMFNSYLEG